jgi:hypothetical protein
MVVTLHHVYIICVHMRPIYDALLQKLVLQKKNNSSFWKKNGTVFIYPNKRKLGEQRRFIMSHYFTRTGYTCTFSVKP